jgi:hypothetical protein
VKGTDRTLVYLEKKTIFAAKMLKDGTLGDAKARGNVANAGRVIAMFRKMQRSRLDDADPFGLGTWTGRRVMLIERRSDAIAGDSRHND